MSALPHPRSTYAEYVRREEVAPYKSEFYRGEVFAMAGGSLRHNKISGNIFANLWNKLRGSPCRSHNSDQRIRVSANGLATYPDVSVVCGEAQIDPQDRQAINNPRVIFELLSPATESYDQGKKFHLYQELPSLQEYVLVSQEEPLVERFVRQADGDWKLTAFKSLESELELSAVPCRLLLAEIYEDVKFGPEEPA